MKQASVASKNPIPIFEKRHLLKALIALKRGGKDEPGNMQWQTITEAKAKDRIED